MNKKAILGILLVLCIIAAGLVGCSDKKDPENSSTTTTPTSTSGTSEPAALSENSAFAPYSSDQILAVIINEPFGDDTPTATVTWDNSDYDRAYVIPRYNGTRVELYSIITTEGGEEVISESPLYSVESSADNCVIYGSFFRAEGMAVLFLKVTAPDGSVGEFFFNYDGNTGTPHIEYVTAK